jgi:Ca2+:H+ antiporter
MGKPSDEPSTDRVRYLASDVSNKYSSSKKPDFQGSHFPRTRPSPPLQQHPGNHVGADSPSRSATDITHQVINNGISAFNTGPSDHAPPTASPAAPSPEDTQAQSEKPSAVDLGGQAAPAANKPSIPVRLWNGTKRFGSHTRDAVFHSYVNVLLVFVPIGIAANFAHLRPEIVFAMNAIAIVPLAGLLTYATESVAKRLGDTLGALLNVSFGNAVELIILYVQSLLLPRWRLLTTLPACT